MTRQCVCVQRSWEYTFTSTADHGFDEAWTIYRQQLFGALAWWTGTLGQPPNAPEMQPKDSSLQFIGRMATAIDDLDALESF